MLILRLFYTIPVGFRESCVYCYAEILRINSVQVPGIDTLACVVRLDHHQIARCNWECYCSIDGIIVVL